MTTIFYLLIAFLALLLLAWVHTGQSPFELWKIRGQFLTAMRIRAKLWFERQGAKVEARIQEVKIMIDKLRGGK